MVGAPFQEGRYKIPKSLNSNLEIYTSITKNITIHPEKLLKPRGCSSTHLGV